MENKIYSFIGLAKKAGKLLAGEYNCEKAIEKSAAWLIIIARNASDNTKKKYIDACRFRKIDYVIFGDKELLGRAIGKDIRAAVAITEEGFSKKLKQMISEYLTQAESAEVE